MAPAIFNDKTRENIRAKMLNIGFELIKKNGYKKTSVENITKLSGIAKGTFYNFFDSKEHLVVEIIAYRNTCILRNINSYCENKEFNNREDVIKLAQYIFSAENENLYSYLTFVEIEQIIKKQPNFIAPDKSVKDVIKRLISFVPNANANCNWKVIVNYARIISIVKNFDDTASFYKDEIHKNIASILNLIVDEILSTDKNNLMIT